MALPADSLTDSSEQQACSSEVQEDDGESEAIEPGLPEEVALGGWCGLRSRVGLARSVQMASPSQRVPC